MEPIRKSEIKIGKDKWNIYYRPTLHFKGEYKSVIKLLNIKCIYLALNDENGKPLSIQEIVINLQKAILPLLEEDAKKLFNIE